MVDRKTSSNCTLGLDIGSNSIGWALIEGLSIRAAGVRVFPEGVDRDQKGAEYSKNEQRRIARGMRRQIARRARRKRTLRLALVEAGLLPDVMALPREDSRRDAWESEQFKKDDPHALRARSLRQRLEPHEIGRVLLHLSQRRGFLSNRKADRARKKENSKMLAEISTLANDMGNSMLGEYLDSLRSGNALTRLRGKHTRRSMLEDEFEAVWEAQRTHHPTLNDELKYGRIGRQHYPQEPRSLRKGTNAVREYGIYGIIFYQRPMYWPKSVVGQCELEPKLKRCPRADRQAQRFRLLQEVNNLRMLDTNTGEERPLTPEERTGLIDYLAASKERKFDDIRKHFCRRFGTPETIRFNLERGDRKKLLGMPTDAILSHKNLFGKDWHDRAEDEKNAIVRVLLDSDDDAIVARATAEWGLDRDTAEALLDADFDEGYSSFSRVAIQRLLPHLERGLLMMTRDGTPSAMSAAGYLRPDQRVANQRDSLPPPPMLTNPLVRQALHEVRKVVNAIIREYGMPKCIHIELAREVKGTLADRARRSSDMREREQVRDAAAHEIRAMNIRVSRDAIERYLLWNEQHRECIYSGRPISLAQLFGGDIEVDHILPYSRSLDNSMMNRVLCFRLENSGDKGKNQRTPQEWLAGVNDRKYEEVLQRSARLPYAKARKFRQQGVQLDEFIARQLVDTAYITSKVREYVECLGTDVICSKGQTTAELRHYWGLDTILRDLEDSPAWEAAQELPAGEKNRLDHRHHAIDAVVIALTDRVRLAQLAGIRRRGGTTTTGEILPEPWVDFRDHVASAIRAINVSHRVQRKVGGALHEETIYGTTATPGEFVYRKPLEALTTAMIDDIRDEHVRRLVVERLAKHGLEPGSRKKIPVEVWKEPLLMTRKPGRQTSSPTHIKRIRLIRREGTIQPIRDGRAFVRPGSTHHLCIFQLGDSAQPDRDAIFVSMLEAARRCRDNEPLIRREFPTRSDGRFVMSLSAGEMVMIKGEERSQLYKFVTAASTSKQMWFRHHAAGGKASEKIGVVSKNPNTLLAQKVTVDPIGRIRWAND